jgi:hypothetical protein
LPLVVARELHPVLVHEKTRGFQRQQWSGERVAEIDDAGHRTAVRIFDHRLQRGQIAVDVGDQCDPHGN